MLTGLLAEAHIDESAFQIRSSWVQFCSIVRFWRFEKSITYVFSTRKIFRLLPPPPTVLLCLFQREIPGK